MSNGEKFLWTQEFLWTQNADPRPDPKVKRNKKSEKKKN